MKGIALAFLLCLSAKAAPDINPLHASPQVVKSPKQAALPQTVSMVRTLSVIVLPKNVTISWQYPYAMDTINFEVWHSTNLINWSLLVVTNQNSTQTTANLPIEYFKVRAVNGGQYPSAWATN